MEWERYLRLLMGRTYNPYPHLLFVIFYPMAMGIFLSLPGFLNKIKKAGSWKIDWILLTAAGVPILYTAIAPVIYFSPISKFFFPKLTSQLFASNLIPQIICGLIFGYLLLSCFDKEKQQ
jgi:hypothetical protein